MLGEVQINDIVELLMKIILNLSSTIIWDFLCVIN